MHESSNPSAVGMCEKKKCTETRSRSTGISNAINLFKFLPLDNNEDLTIPGFPDASSERISEERERRVEGRVGGEVNRY